MPAVYFILGLTLVFIHCKLTKSIDWTWPWVLSPLLLSAAAWLLIAIVAFNTVR